MLRKTYIEQIRRAIYNGQPSDDATITVGLVNVWLDQAIAFAAKQNYKDSLSIDGISYLNNSFYTTFKALPVVADEQFVWKVVLPQIPFGIGQNEGVSMLQFKDAATKQISQTVVWLTQAQKSFFQNVRTIPNKLLAISEGKNVYIYTDILLDEYTATVTIASGGNSTDLNSELNVPSDYIPAMTEYLMKNLMLVHQQPVDSTNDGLDAPRGTD
jgi:hypothetical protein